MQHFHVSDVGTLDCQLKFATPLPHNVSALVMAIRDVQYEHLPLSMQNDMRLL